MNGATVAVMCGVWGGAGAMLAALLAFRGLLPGVVPAADVDARGLVG